MEQYGPEDIVVILGCPTGESSEVFARTVTEGDPSWVGPLAGIALSLPVYHVVESEMKEQFDPEVYRQQVSIMESVLEIEEVIEAVRSVREGVG